MKKQPVVVWERGRKLRHQVKTVRFAFLCLERERTITEDYVVS